MPMKNKKIDPTRTERCFSILGGTSALSPCLHWMNPKMIASSGAPTRRPTIRAECQGFFCPPHWSASTKQHTEPKNVLILAKSILANSSLGGSDRTSSLSLRILRNRPRSTTATPPMGKLLAVLSSNRHEQIAITYIQKHHLHPKLSTNAPPIIGPTHIEIPKTLMTIPMKSGLRSSCTMRVIIESAPWRRPVAQLQQEVCQ